MKRALSAEQQGAILAAVGEMLRATLASREPDLPDPTLSGASERSVDGAFVTLKRGKHLRSCCGFLGRSLPLLQAIREAADRTAWEDPRFPPISPGELEHLDVEVWLLGPPEPVEAEGAERVHAVTVGKHGLSITRGQAHGLLLPCVAMDHDWDAHTFLEHVCMKAGLHPTAWKDNGTSLFTFEGEAVSGRLADLRDATQTVGRPAWLSADELRKLATFCRENLTAFLEGATPSFYAFGLPDRQVTGAALIVRRQDGEPMTSHQLALRPGMPLQSTLFSLTRTLAGLLAEHGAAADGVDALSVGLAVFFDPFLHGTVADADLAGLDPLHRSLLVIERIRSGLAYRPAQAPAELLAEAARQAQVQEPAAAIVYSLATLTTETAVALTSVPRPVRGPAIRPPGVAGTFYPASPAELDRLVTGLLGEERRAEVWPAVMVPHAGLMYSGEIAAGVLRRLKIPRTVIILGPKHTALGVDWAIAPHQTWAVPGHTLASDPALAAEIAASVPGLELDALGHQNEHAIEVELPFLARLAPETRVIGIAIGEGRWKTCQRFAEGLADVLRRQEEPPLLIISSDMNHFATDVENRRLDEMALAAMEMLDPKTLLETVRENHISMCGVLPAVIVMETLRLLGRLTRTERAGYKTSGDVTGDRSRVVGYAGMLIG